MRTVTVMTDIYELYIVKKELISDQTLTTIKKIKTLSYKRVVAGQPCVLLLITTET